MLRPQIARKAKEFPAVVGALANSFAAGALLAAAFFLMMYEASIYNPLHLSYMLTVPDVMLTVSC